MTSDCSDVVFFYLLGFPTFIMRMQEQMYINGFYLLHAFDRKIT